MKEYIVKVLFLNDKNIFIHVMKNNKGKFYFIVFENLNDPIELFYSSEFNSIDECLINAETHLIKNF